MSENVVIDEALSEPIDEGIHERAAKVIILLPESWSDLTHIYPATTESLMKLFRKEAAPVEVLDRDAELLLRDNRSADWFAPTMFVSQLLFTENPLAVSLALDIVSSYVTDYFKGTKTDPKVRLSIIHSSIGVRRVRKLRYEGPVSGLGEIKEILTQWNRDKT
jgi:hypothetical protein